MFEMSMFLIALSAALIIGVQCNWNSGSKQSAEGPSRRSFRVSDEAPGGMGRQEGISNTHFDTHFTRLIYDPLSDLMIPHTFQRRQPIFMPEPKVQPPVDSAGEQTKRKRGRPIGSKTRKKPAIENDVFPPKRKVGRPRGSKNVQQGNFQGTLKMDDSGSNLVETSTKSTKQLNNKGHAFTNRGEVRSSEILGRQTSHSTEQFGVNNPDQVGGSQISDGHPLLGVKRFGFNSDESSFKMPWEKNSSASPQGRNQSPISSPNSGIPTSDRGKSVETRGPSPDSDDEFDALLRSFIDDDTP